MTSARVILLSSLILSAACATPRRGLASVDDEPTRFDGKWETVVKRCGIPGDVTQITRDIVEANARHRGGITLDFETAHSKLIATPPATLNVSRRNYTFDQRDGDCPHVVTSGRVEDDGRDGALVPATRQGCEGPSKKVEGEAAAPLSFSDEYLVEQRPLEDCPSDRVTQRIWRRAGG